MMSRKGSNWVDRDDPLEDTLARVLGHPLFLDADDTRLAPHVLTVRGLVEADATEVHVTRFIRTLFPLFDQPEPDPKLTRTLGIALWHIAKAGLVRDRARRRAEELVRQLPPPPSLAKQLTDAILRAP